MSIFTEKIKKEEEMAKREGELGYMSFGSLTAFREAEAMHEKFIEDLKKEIVDNQDLDIMIEYPLGCDVTITLNKLIDILNQSQTQETTNE